MANQLQSSLLAVFSQQSEFERFMQLLHMEHTFAIWSLIASLIIGAVSGLVGSFMVLRRMSLIGDAVGHSTLPGVAAGFLIVSAKISWVMLLCAAVTGIIAAWMVSFLDSGERSRSDASIAVVISGGFGIGAILFTVAQASPTGAQAGLGSIFFGNVAAISPSDVSVIAISSAILAATVLLFWRPITLSIFDRTFAQSVGVPIRAIDTLLLLMLAITVVVSVQAVGVVLVASMLIIPPTTARLLTHSLPVMAILSACFGALCGVLGAVVSYLYEGVATGPAMVLFAVLGFVIALFIRMLRGEGATVIEPTTPLVTALSEKNLETSRGGEV